MSGIFLPLAGDTLSVSDWPQFVLLGLALAIVVVCIRIYGRLLAQVLTGRGKVWNEPLGIPDLLVVCVLVMWLAGSLVRAFSRPEHPSAVTDSAILQSAVLFGFIVGGISLFLQTRQISVMRLFGFRRVHFLQMLKFGAGLFLAALPLVFLCFALVRLYAGAEDHEPQEIVKFFSEAARRSEWSRMALGLIFGVVVAPVTEEFIFRGYFYGVLRRYLGIVPALLLVSALFAAIHLSVPVLLPLFVLAVCLTLAYEATGSLLVPMLMHALFNAFMFSVMIYSAHHPS